MSGEDKSFIYKTLNEATALLNQEVATGQTNAYITMDRGRYAELLRAIVEAKKMLIRPSSDLCDS